MSGGVPVYVMLPLDTVNADGVFAYASTPWFTGALNFLSSSGVKGVAIDCWWGAVERKPKQYDFTAYRQVAKLVRRCNLRLQVVMSFHACGSNVNDTVSIPLPDWVLEAGKKEPDLFFMDRPREGSSVGRRNFECVSFFADNVRCLEGRTPVECYHDMMAAFSAAMSDMMGGVIEEIVVGTGPCGELRYPSYVESNGWKFPGVGEFQCFDRRAMASLAQAAHEAGHPEWGMQCPDGVGEYNNTPNDAPFFAWNGGWQTPQGDFFLRWYSAALVTHGQRVLDAAVRVFYPYLYASVQQRIRERGVVRVDSIAAAPLACARVGSDAAFGQSDLGSVPSELGNVHAGAGGAGARTEGGGAAAAAPGRTVSPNPTQISSVHSQRSLPMGLCDLANESSAARPVAEADEGVTLQWDESPHTPSPARDAPPPQHEFTPMQLGYGAAAGRPDSYGGGLHSAPGSMRNMTWKGLRAGEMPALPESEPLHHAVATTPGGVGRRGGAPRSASKSEPMLATGGGEGYRNGVAGPAGDASCSPEQVAMLASSLERIRSLEAMLGSDDGRDGGSGEPVEPSIHTSCSSSFMSVASAADFRRESSSSLLMSVKIAGVHWWYHTPSHAAELTAGYYNSNGHDGYHDIIRMCADHGAEVILTCVEMNDAQHPPDAHCGPEALLRQVREGAYQAGLLIAGENALPCISRHGVNTYALEHIVKNSHAFYTIPRRASESTDRGLAHHHHLRGRALDKAAWKPCSHKAASSDGYLIGQRAAHGGVAATRGLPHVLSGPSDGRAAGAALAMRKATSWIDLNARTSDLLSSPENSALNTPISVFGGAKSAPKNVAADDEAWPTCEGHLTMPYSMGSHGDLTEAASLAGGGHSAPLLPIVAEARPGPPRDAGRPHRSAAGLPSPAKHAASASQPSDAASAEPSDAAGAPAFLPPMRMFTFLRMCPEMLHPGHSGQWLHFMRRMQSRG